MSPEGMMLKDDKKHRVVVNSTVVCFESVKPGNNGQLLHSAVAISKNDYMLPPLTLLEVVSVEEGTLTLSSSESINSPSKVRSNTRTARPCSRAWSPFGRRTSSRRPRRRLSLG